MPNDPQTAPAASRYDRPSPSVPSIDRPWDDLEERAHRLQTNHRDRSTHRAHHSLFEDMLN